MAEAEQEPPTLSKAEMQSYREELVEELEDLEAAQKKWPSEYKAQRIDILRRRLT